MKEKTKKLADFPLKVRQTLDAFAKTMATGQNSVASQICDAILGDLDRLCEEYKENRKKLKKGEGEEKKVMELLSDIPGVETELKHGTSIKAGVYAGLIIGKGALWINLGFLEASVIKLIEKRLSKMAGCQPKEELTLITSPFNTARHHEHFSTRSYVTRAGIYEVSKAWYATSIKKRVDFDD